MQSIFHFKGLNYYISAASIHTSPSVDPFLLLLSHKRWIFFRVVWKSWAWYLILTFLPRSQTSSRFSVLFWNLIIYHLRLAFPFHFVLCFCPRFSLFYSLTISQLLPFLSSLTIIYFLGALSCPFVFVRDFQTCQISTICTRRVVQPAAIGIQCVLVDYCIYCACYQCRKMHCW